MKDVKEVKRFYQRKLKFKKNLSGWLLMLIPIMLFILQVWRPIGINILYSFFRIKAFKLEEFVGLENFKDVLMDSALLQTFFNTLKYVFWSLVIGLPLPFIASVMLNEMIHAKGFFKFTTYVPAIIPGVAVAMIWRMIYLDGSGGLLNMILYNLGIEPIGWLSNKNLVIPLIIISTTWQGFGSTMIMYLASLQSVNQELYEAARLDGAGFWGRIRYVLMPHMSGILLLLGIKQIITVFGITEQPMVMTGGGPNGASMSLGLTSYFYAFKFNQFEKSMALSVLCFLLMVGLTFVYFKMDKKFSE